MVDRWRAIPTSWGKDPRFYRLNPRSTKLLILLHLASRDGIIRAEDASDLVTRTGINFRPDRLKGAIEQLAREGFIRFGSGELVLIEHVQVGKAGPKRPGAAWPQRRGREGASRPGKSEEKRGDDSTAFARAHQKENAKAFSKEGSEKGARDGAPFQIDEARRAALAKQAERIRRANLDPLEE